jgi:Uma2 family endonuclease
MTADEFARFVSAPENSDRRFELIDGQLVEKLPTMLQGVIKAQLGGELGIYLRENPVGWAGFSVDYSLPTDPLNVRSPDISFILKEGRTLLREGFVPYMPEIAVEVQLPEQSDTFMKEKGDYYLAHGTKIVWIVYPRQQLVEVLTPTERHLLTINDTLTGGDVLPGFSVPIREIFPKVE